MFQLFKVVEFDHFKIIHISLKIIYNKLQKLYNAKKMSNTAPFLLDLKHKIYTHHIFPLYLKKTAISETGINNQSKFHRLHAWRSILIFLPSDFL